VIRLFKFDNRPLAHGTLVNHRFQEHGVRILGDLGQTILHGLPFGGHSVDGAHNSLKADRRSEGSSSRYSLMVAALDCMVTPMVDEQIQPSVPPHKPAVHAGPIP
jgi:hypothetical protein